MNIWIITLIIIILCSKLFNTSTAAGKKKYLILAGLILIFVMGSRNAILQYGTDLNNYYRLYERAINSDWKTFLANSADFEKGYMVLNYIFAKIIPWSQFIIYLQATICITCTFVFIYLNTKKDILFSVVLFMTTGSFLFFLTGFRQALAISFCMMAFEAAKRKRLIIFIIWTVLATLMHQTAIIFILAYLIIQINTRRSQAVLFVIIIMSSFFTGNFVDWSNEIFNKNYTTGYVGNILGGIVQILVIVLCITAYYILRRRKRVLKIDAHDDNDIILYRFTIISLFIYILRYSTVIMERMSYYFLYAMPVLMEREISDNSFPNRRVVKTIGFICCFILFWWRTSEMTYAFFWR
jgi:hypothetical protein